MKARFLTIITLAVAAAACTMQAERAVIEELGCPQTVVNLPPEGGDAAFTIYAGGAWEGVLEADWLSLPGSAERTFSGTGDSSLLLHAGHNAGDTRTGTATLTLGARNIVLSVVQRGDLSTDTSVAAEFIGATSSTLTFSFGEGETEAAMRANPYRFALYADADTTQLVVAHYVDAASTIWNGRPRFTFGGLESGKTYYFAAINKATGNCSAIKEASTLPFTRVLPAEVYDPAPGTVLLAEDFSEIPWNGDDVQGGAGFRAAETSVFQAPSGERPDGGYGNKSYECQLFDASGFLDAADKSSLAQWSVMGQSGAPANRVKMVFARAGYVKLGGYSYCAALVSPALAGIPEGYSAKVLVKFTASRYATDSQKFLLSVVEGAEDSHVFTPHKRSDNARNLKNEPQWGEYEAELEGLTMDSRIMIGPDWDAEGSGNGKTQHRMFLGDISVTVLSLTQEYEPVKPTIAASLVTRTSSTVTVDWTYGGEIATDNSHSYRFGLFNDHSCKSVLGGNQFVSKADDASASWDGKRTRFTFSGIDPLTTCYFKVWDVTDGQAFSNTVKIEPVEAFEIVRIADVSPEEVLSALDAKSEKLIYAEDFSELRWNGDSFNYASGISIPSGTRTSFSAVGGTIKRWSDNANDYTFTNNAAALSESRLADWKYYYPNNVAHISIRPGYIQVSSGSNKSYALSPALDNLPEGRSATIRVKVSVGNYPGGPGQGVLMVYHDEESVSDGIRITSPISIPSEANLKELVCTSWSSADGYTQREWQEKTLEFTGVKKGDRILFGPAASAAANKGRLLLSDISITVIAIEQ